MASKNKNKPTKELTSLLKRIYLGEDPQILRREVTRFIGQVDPSDIVAAEQNLIDDGYSSQLVRELSATFMLMGIPQEQGDNPRLWLPPGHLLRIVFAEHDMFRCFLAGLVEATEAIEHMDNPTSTSTEFRKLAHIAEHLNAMVEHIDREDSEFFPAAEAALTRDDLDRLAGRLPKLDDLLFGAADRDSYVRLRQNILDWSREGSAGA